MYAFEHLQYSIYGFAPKEQKCANVVTKSFVFLNDLFTGAVKKLILIVLLYYAEVTMESFCSLDELVADAKKHFLVLIKFGTLENLKSLQNGSLYMKNLSKESKQILRSAFSNSIISAVPEGFIKKQTVRV